MVSLRAKVLLAAGFAFNAGWANVVCLWRYSAFATMMTGNLILCGRFAALTMLTTVNFEHPLSQTPWYFYLCVIVSYMFGAILYLFVRMKHIN